jgi:hypothetical protein
MRPYTETPASEPGSGSGSEALADSVFQYDLFAVVTHEGKLDNGHYWADVLSSGEWWHCDDDKGEWRKSALIPIVKWLGLMGSNADVSWSCIGPKGIYVVLRQEVIGICPTCPEADNERLDLDNTEWGCERSLGCHWSMTASASACTCTRTRECMYRVKSHV